jgi:hypothetical protein
MYFFLILIYNMSTPTAMTFYLDQFQTEVSADLLNLVTPTSYMIVSSSKFDIDVSLSEVNKMFQFKNPTPSSTTGGALITSDTTLYNTLNTINIDFSYATINQTDSTASYAKSGEDIGEFYLSYILSKFTGYDSSIFTNSPAVKTSTVSKATTAINLKINSYYNAGGNTKPSESAESSSVPTYRLLKQMSPSELSLRFNTTVLSEAINDFKPVPLIVGDTIAFLINLNPGTGQKDLNNTAIGQVNALVRMHVVE